MQITLSGVFVSHIDICIYPYPWHSTTYAGDNVSTTSIVSLYPLCQISVVTYDLTPITIYSGKDLRVFGCGSEARGLYLRHVSKRH